MDTGLAGIYEEKGVNISELVWILSPQSKRGDMKFQKFSDRNDLYSILRLRKK